jgi:quinol monooxygenase YgiN
MIYALVTFHVQPSKIHEFESLHRALARFISSQPGCIAVKVHRSLKNPQEYVVYGTWEGKEAWERAHQTAEDTVPESADRAAHALKRELL